MKKMYLLIALLSLTALSTRAQNDPEKLLAQVKDAFNQVKDYEVDVNIIIDVEFLKVPETNAKIYFKQPDKVKVDAEGFALMPREGLNFSPNSLLKENYTALFEKDEKVDGFNCAVVKIIPLGSGTSVILSTVWIDRKNSVIRKVETTTKTNGTFNIDLKYDLGKTKYPLPVSIVFAFEVNKLNLPKGFSGDTSKKKKDNGKDTAPGKVYVKYSNYKINKGISDKVFEEKK